MRHGEILTCLVMEKSRQWKKVSLEKDIGGI